MSWGVGNPKHCPLIHTYEDAAAWFARRGPVKSDRWEKNERPLVTSTEHWFRLVEADDLSYYDLHGFRAEPSIRYMRPAPDGSRMVFLRHRYHYELQFLAEMGWNTEAVPVVVSAKKKVYVPLSTHMLERPLCGVPAEWSASLKFSKNKCLILSQSAHRPMYRLEVPKNAVKKRAEVRKAIKDIIHLMTLRIPTFHENSVLTSRLAGSFTKVHTAERAAEFMEEILDAKGSLVIPDGFLAYAQEVYDMRVSRLAKMHDDYRHRYFYKEDSHTVPPVDAEDFRRSLTNVFISNMGVNKPTEKHGMPRFPTKLPSSDRRCYA